MRMTTYAELERVVQAFAGGNLKLLILVGGHGLANPDPAPGLGRPGVLNRGFDVQRTDRASRRTP
jgi:hypothetical protein